MKRDPRSSPFWVISAGLLVPVGFPGGLDGKESDCNAGGPGSIPGLGDPLQEGMATHPVFLPGEFHGRKSLVGYGPRGSKESDTTEPA